MLTGLELTCGPSRPCQLHRGYEIQPAARAMQSVPGHRTWPTLLLSWDKGPNQPVVIDELSSGEPSPGGYASGRRLCNSSTR